MRTFTSVIFLLHAALLLIGPSADSIKQRNRCKYGHISDWSKCDISTMTSSRSLELLSGDSEMCGKNKVETRNCGKDDDDENRKKDNITRHQLNKRRRLKWRKKQTLLQPECKYKKSRWSRCESLKDQTQTLVETLVPGSPAYCEQAIVLTRACVGRLEMVETEEHSVEGGVRRERKNNRGEPMKRRKQRNKGQMEENKKKKRTNNKSPSELPTEAPVPAELRVEPHATFAIVSWQPPQHDGLDGHIPVDSYKIGYGQGFPDLHSVDVSGEELTYRIKNLEPGREYIVSLRASTIWGISQPLYETIRTHNAAKVMEQVILPPVGVKSTVLSSEAIKVSWIDQSEHGEPSSLRREYFLRYRQLSHLSSSASHQNDFRVQHTPDTSVVISGLQPFTKYEFAVMATVGGRNSSLSAITWNVTYEDAPSTPPQDLTIIGDPDSPDQVTLSWQPPSKANGVLTGYQVTYSTTTVKGQSVVETKNISGNKLSATVTGLIPGLTYDFSIRARNSQGMGPPLSIKSYQFLGGPAPTSVVLKAPTTKKEPSAENLMWEITLPVAVNISGDEAMITLIRPPRELHVNVLTSTSVVVTWQELEPLETSEDDSTSASLIYTVRYCNLDTDLLNCSTISSPFTSLYVADLMPFTWYEFAVKAHLGNQESGWSTPVRNRTFASDVFQYPLKAEVRGQKQSSQAAILSWYPGANSKFKEYVVLYSQDVGQSHRQWTQKATVSSSKQQYLFDSLNPATTYFFIVQAMTDLGPGPRSKILSYTTGKDEKSSASLPKPENLQVIVMSPNSALISWRDAGLTRDREGKTERPVTSYSYTLRYRDLNREPSWYKLASPTLSSIFMVDLEPATRYEFSVRTVSGDQHSDWSSPVVNTTFETAPSTGPSHVTVSLDDGDPTTAFLTWQPPESPNGDITGYIVFYETATERRSAAVPAGELSYRISFLKPHTKYFIRIGARNSQGFSPLSNRVVYRTPRVVGTPPTDVTVSPALDDLYNVIVSWQPPSPNKKKIKFYTITHYTEDGKQRTVQKVPGFTLTTTVKKLLPSTVYHFTVQAHYQRGSGPHSAACKYSIPKELLTAGLSS